MDNFEIVNKIYNNNLTILRPDDTFEFSCSICGDCCRNRQDDILLSPYDIYRISKYTKMVPHDIISKYCYYYLGKDSKLPVTVIKFKKMKLLQEHTLLVHS